MARRPRSPFDAFFDQVIDNVLDRLEDELTPALEEISSRVADSVEKQVKRASNQSNPRPRQERPPRNVLRCTLCGKRPKDCLCRRTRSETREGQETRPSPSKPQQSTLYDELEVSPKASIETIRAAYRSLSTRFHPDKNPGDHGAEERMKRINEAWQVLEDEKKRRAYDRMLNR